MEQYLDKIVKAPPGVKFGGLAAAVVAMTAINFFLTAATSLLPILVTKHFGGAAMHLASLSSAFGIGIIAGGMALGVWGGFRRRMQTSLTGLIGLGLGFLLLGLTPATMFWMALATTVLAAVMSSMTDGPLMAVLQTTVPQGATEGTGVATVLVNTREFGDVTAQTSITVKP